MLHTRGVFQDGFMPQKMGVYASENGSMTHERGV